MKKFILLSLIASVSAQAHFVRLEENASQQELQNTVKSLLGLPSQYARVAEKLIYHTAHEFDAAKADQEFFDKQSRKNLYECAAAVEATVQSSRRYGSREIAVINMQLARESARAYQDLRSSNPETPYIPAALFYLNAFFPKSAQSLCNKFINFQENLRTADVNQKPPHMK